MRVLYLSNSPKLGGVNRYLQTLFGHLPNEVEPIVVCPVDGPMAEECRALGVACAIVPYPQPSWRSPCETLASLTVWRRAIRRFRPDVIHAKDFYNARSASAAAHLAGVPLICHVQFPAPPHALAWMYRRLPKPEAFIYNSAATRDEVEPTLRACCPRAKQAVIHNCVDLDHYQSAPERSRCEGLPRVAIVANLLRVKGHLDFLAMARRLEQAGRKAEYWIIGGETVEIGYGATLRRQCTEWGLDHCVRFLGSRSDVRQLLREVDVAVCTSHVEPFGICNLESMACGLPVVATCVGGIPEVVQDGVTGYLAPPGRPDVLAEHVAALLANDELRRRFGSAGRTRVQQMFGAREHARKIVDFYQSLTA